MAYLGSMDAVSDRLNEAAKRVVNEDRLNFSMKVMAPVGTFPEIQSQYGGQANEIQNGLILWTKQWKDIIARKSTADAKQWEDAALALAISGEKLHDQVLKLEDLVYRRDWTGFKQGLVTAFAVVTAIPRAVPWAVKAVARETVSAAGEVTQQAAGELKKTFENLGISTSKILYVAGGVLAAYLVLPRLLASFGKPK